MFPDICLVYGPLITLVISLLKKVTWVNNNPKTAAAILAGLISLAKLALPGENYSGVINLLICFATQFAASVATYEVVKSVKQDIA